jgi:hypothetical protein
MAEVLVRTFIEMLRRRCIPMLLTKERIEMIYMMSQSLLAFYHPTGEGFLLSLMIPNFVHLNRYVLMY